MDIMDYGFQKKVVFFRTDRNKLYEQEKENKLI